MIDMKYKVMALALLSASVISCVPTHNEEVAIPADEIALIDSAIDSGGDCPIYESRGWHAWVDKLGDEEHEYRLNVYGMVDLPTPNFDISWSMGITDRAFPPGQVVRLHVQPASAAPAIQVITTKPLQITFPTHFSAYRNVKVVCAGQLIATIPDVALSD